jgi:hypothetical protein
MTNHEAVAWLEDQDLSCAARREWANSLDNRSQRELPDGEDDCTVVPTQFFTLKLDHETENKQYGCRMCGWSEANLIVVGE